MLLKEMRRWLGNKAMQSFTTDLASHSQLDKEANLLRHARTRAQSCCLAKVEQVFRQGID